MKMTSMMVVIKMVVVITMMMVVVEMLKIVVVKMETGTCQNNFPVAEAIRLQPFLEV